MTFQKHHSDDFVFLVKLAEGVPGPRVRACALAVCVWLLELHLAPSALTLGVPALQLSSSSSQLPSCPFPRPSVFPRLHASEVAPLSLCSHDKGHLQGTPETNSLKAPVPLPEPGNYLAVTALWLQFYILLGDYLPRQEAP